MYNWTVLGCYTDPSPVKEWADDCDAHRVALGGQRVLFALRCRTAVELGLVPELPDVQVQHCGHKSISKLKGSQVGRVFDTYDVIRERQVRD